MKDSHPAVLAGATKTIHEEHPGFLFMAEVYWDLEWTFPQQGPAWAYHEF